MQFNRAGALTLALATLAACGSGSDGPTGPDAIAPAATEPAAAWRSETPLPVAMAEVGVTALGDVLYVVGGTEQPAGRDPIRDSSLALAYDMASGDWRELSPLPRGASHVGLTALDGKLYALGGFTNIVHMDPQASAWVYDPATDAWAPLPDLSSPRGSVGAAAVGGKVHVLGGRQADEILPVPTPPGTPELFETRGTVTLHQVFDPESGQWSDAAPLPGPGRDHMGIAVLGERIHVFGGRVASTDDNLTRHDVYDPATDTWSSAAPLPEPRSAGAATVIGRRILYAGGECMPGGEGSTPNAYDTVTSYDAELDRWTAGLPLPSARHGFGGATLGERAYFAAGAPVCGGGAMADLTSVSADAHEDESATTGQ